MKAHLVHPIWWLLGCSLVLAACHEESDSGLSINARLGGLTVSVAGLDQPFDPALTNYTATMDFEGSTTTVTATTADSGATQSAQRTQ